MGVITEKFTIQTKGFTDIIDITENVQNCVYRHSMKDGMIHVYIPGSTCSITTIEYEPGLLKDLPEILEELIPSQKDYHHDDTWHDGNGYAHIRASIIGNSITVPLIDGALYLGTWQQAVLIDFDNRERTRTVYVQILS